MKFRPNIWAAEVKEAEALKKKHHVQPGEILWLLDHWRYPFTEHPIAKHLSKLWGRK